ncbi:hypothetical protein QEH59_14585 [Coraliomargarita sp. SDUM461004]|uniref:DUF350 domain-containing protein n=1 Tax=Thalassobacterium sedimentorum TaxID=3041258 RepID=A0ABU1ALJ6_9BACT|nr:hypothetical protein [Coraliomargarita sp. SDUM461004]MDQ8195658.1 hypothetical protein [Coraliomargarita sp. SDUM461004]
MNTITAPIVIAQANLSDLKEMFSLALGVIFFFGFVYGIFLIWRGARKIADGDSEGYSSIFGGIIIAAAGLIMSAFFVLAGIGDAVITPTF